MIGGFEVGFRELPEAGTALASIPSLGRANAHLRVAGAFTLGRDLYALLGDEMVRHVRVLRDLVGDLFGNDWPTLAARLSHPPEARALLGAADDESDPFEMGRIDFVISGGVPRIVEFNLTSSMGSTAGIEKVQRDLAACSGLGVAGMPNRARLDLVLRELRRGGSNRVYLPTWPWSHIPDPVDFFRESCEYLARQGASVHIVTLADLAGELAAYPDAVVLRLFDTSDALAAGIDLAAIGLGTARRGRWVMGEAPNVVSSKSLLACRPVQEALGEGQGHLAPTWHVGGAVAGDPGLQAIDLAALLERQGEFVLKPACGHSGQQVAIGPQLSVEAWRQALAATQREPFVAQRWFPPDAVETTFFDLHSGEMFVRRTPAVYGIYVIRDRAQGVLVRVLPERAPLGAINSGRGAVISALMLQ